MARTFPRRARKRPRKVRLTPKPRLSSKPREFARRFAPGCPPVEAVTEPRLAEAERKYLGRQLAYLLEGTYLGGWV